MSRTGSISRSIQIDGSIDQRRFRNPSSHLSFFQIPIRIAAQCSCILHPSPPSMHSSRIVTASASCGVATHAAITINFSSDLGVIPIYTRTPSRLHTESIYNLHTHPFFCRGRALLAASSPTRLRHLLSSLAA